MKKLNILKTLLFLPTLSIIPFSFISHQPTTLINKTSSLTTVGDTFTIQSGGDWGGTAGALTFKILKEASGNTPGEVSLTMGSSWVGSLIINPAVVYANNNYDVTTIGNNAFLSSTSLTSIVFSSVSKISILESAFQNCTNLLTVEFSSLTEVALGTNAFSSCGKLVGIDFPKLIKATFGNKVFQSCVLFSYFNAPLLPSASFGNQTFQYDSKLADVDFSNLQTCTFGTETFQSCYMLKHLEFPKLISSSFGYASFQSSPLATINFPLLTTGSFDNNCFQGCPLSSLYIPLFSGTFGTYTFSYCSLLAEVNLSSLPNGSSFPASLFTYDNVLSKMIFGDVDPTTISFNNSWIYGANSGNPIDFYVPYTTVDAWQEIYDNSSWNAVINFIGYTPAISASVTENKLVERSVSSTATLTITQAEFTPNLSTLSADLGKSGLSISSFEDGVAIIKTNKASAGTKHIIISCAGCEDLDVTVVVAHNFNSYLWIILSFSIGLGITLGAAIFFFVDKKRKQEEKK